MPLLRPASVPTQLEAVGSTAYIRGVLIRGLNRHDEGRWVKGSLAYTLLYWGFFPIPHLASPLIV